MRPDELLPAHLAGRLRPWSGVDEDYVRTTRGDNASAVCNGLLTRCFGDAAEIGALAVHDRDLALVALRWATLGPRLPVEITCASCGAEHDVTIDLDRLQRPPEAPSQIVVGELVVRLPTAADQQRVVEAGDADSEARRLRVLACIVDVPGDALSGARRDEIESALESAIPDIDLELVLDCPACGGAIEATIELAQFVLAELRERSRHLLREVHALARTYHWSERDILAMTTIRRQEYLALIEADQTAALFAEATD